MRKATPAEKAKLEDLLRDAELEVIRLKMRLAYLDAFLRELHHQTGGRTFTVRNSIIWQWFWDSHQLAIIELASFSKSLIRSGGLFNRLNDHLVQFRAGVHEELRQRPVMHVHPPRSAQERERIERELHQHAQEALEAEVEKSLRRLFPSLKAGDHASPQDIDALKACFHAAVADLQDRRHAIAHRFEREEDQGLSANLDELRKDFGTIEDILSDLRMVALGSQFAFNAPTGNLERVARDLVDQMLVGGINEIVRAVGMNRDDGPLRYYYQFRKNQPASLACKGSDDQA